MNNDGELYSGAQETFGNENPPEETRKDLEKEQKRAAKELATAEIELRSLNDEITHANALTDFFSSLSSLATDIPEADVRAKIEARQMYLAYLMNRKNLLIADLEDAGYEVSDELTNPEPMQPQQPVTNYVKEDLHGWQLVRRGLREVVGRWL